MSIRYQLLLRLITISIILVGGIAWFAYQDVRHETRELFDAQLARSARLILSLAQSQNTDTGFLKIQKYLNENGQTVMHIDANEQNKKNNIAHIYETKLSFQIWDNKGNLLVKSYNAPMQPLTRQPSGFNNTYIEGYSWRTFSLRSNNGQYF